MQAYLERCEFTFEFLLVPQSGKQMLVRELCLRLTTRFGSFDCIVLVFGACWTFIVTLIRMNSRRFK